MGTESISTGIGLSVPGLYAWNERFEAVLALIARRVRELAPGTGAAFLQFPPTLPRETIDRVGYRDAFPHLLGEVVCVDAAAPHGARVDAPVVLAPAACYHVYPLLCDAPLAHSQRIDVEAWCFRNEAGDGTTRLRAFRMHELVYVGAPESVHAWRGAAMDRATGFAAELGLDAQLAPAADPFFGPRGRLMAARQRAQELKYELLAPLGSQSRSAIASFNCHEAHFGKLFNLRLPSGDTAHTACAAFGLERVASAVILRHGDDPATWPRSVRNVLGI